MYANFPQTTTKCWRLTPTRAYFNNIVASGSIETSIFKKSHTQAVGGAMIFKPSYKIISFSEKELQIEWDFEVEAEDKIWLIPKTGEYSTATIRNVIQGTDSCFITIDEVLTGEFV